MDIGGTGSIASRVFIHDDAVLVFSTVLVESVGRLTLARTARFPVGAVSANQLGTAARDALLQSKPAVTEAEFERIAPHDDPLCVALGAEGPKLLRLLRKARSATVVVWQGEVDFRISYQGGGLDSDLTTLPVAVDDATLGAVLIRGLGLDVSPRAAGWTP